MRIDHTAFGEITIDGKTYEHDVIIRLSLPKTKVVRIGDAIRPRLHGR